MYHFAKIQVSGLYNLIFANRTFGFIRLIMILKVSRLIDVTILFFLFRVDIRGGQ